MRLYKKRAPHTPDYMIKGWSIIQTLADEERANIARFDTALLRLNDESFHLIGLGYETEEADLIGANKIVARKIEFGISDRLLLERQFMISQAFKTLNTAEKNCFKDRFAAIIYRNGEYFLVVDSKKYQDYVHKYGIECLECGQPTEVNDID
jgi:hypothetical protein